MILNISTSRDFLTMVYDTWAASHVRAAALVNAINMYVSMYRSCKKVN
jgi:hypothetical protein